MESYEFIKNKRELHGLSVRDFAKLADITPSALFYYETGHYKLYNLSIGKLLRLFNLLCIDADTFAREYFEDLYKESDNKLAEWKENNPREYSYKVLKKRFRLRISKIAERKNLSEEKLEEIKKLYEENFDKLKKCIGAEELISDEQYEKYILPLSALIRISLDNKDGTERPDNAAVRINNKLAFTDYDYRDLAFLVDISFQLFTMYRKKPEDFDNLTASTAFRIAYVLDADIKYLFSA